MTMAHSSLSCRLGTHRRYISSYRRAENLVGLFGIVMIRVVRVEVSDPPWWLQSPFPLR